MTQPTIEQMIDALNRASVIDGFGRFVVTLSSDMAKSIRAALAEKQGLRLPDGWEIKSVLVRVKKDGKQQEAFSNNYENALKSIKAALAAHNNTKGITAS
jgi:hypothetical protein